MKMQPNSKISGALVSVFFMIIISGCMNGPGFLKQVNSAVKSDNVSTVVVPVEAQADGTLTASLNANSGTVQTIEAPAGSAVAGVQLSFPPGTLAVDTVITMEEGGSLAGTEVAGDLGIAASDTMSASAALVISSSANIDATQPFTVSLVLNNGTGLNLQQTGMQLVVLYKVKKVGSGDGLFVGIIPASELVLVGGKIAFKTRYFGSYQAAYVPVSLPPIVEKAASTPIVTKRAPQPTNETVVNDITSDASISTQQPQIPDRIEIGTITHNSIQVSWATSVAVKEFIIAMVEYSADSADPNSSLLKERCEVSNPRKFPINQNTTTFIALEPRTMYLFRFCIVKEDGEVSTGVLIDAKTLDTPPVDPTQVTVTAVSSRGIRLAIQDSNTNNHNYRIAWNQSASSTVAAPTTCNNGTGKMDISFSGVFEIHDFPAQTYVAVRICGINADGMVSNGINLPIVQTHAFALTCDSGTLDDTCIINSEKIYSDPFVISGLGSLVIHPNAEIRTTMGWRLSIHMKGDVTIATTGTLSADEAGYAGGASGSDGDGSGGGKHHNGHGQGGSMGGQGGFNPAYIALPPAPTQGDFALPMLQVSGYGGGGGGGTGGSGGNGGGFIEIRAHRLFLDGLITANGADGGYAAGGGAGGSVYIHVHEIKTTVTEGVGLGRISVKGGTGGAGGSGGGGGGGGRVAIHFSDTINSNPSNLNLTAWGGSGPFPGAGGTIFWQHQESGSAHLKIDKKLGTSESRTPVAIIQDAYGHHSLTIEVNTDSIANFTGPVPSDAINNLIVSSGARIDQSGLAPKTASTSDAADSTGTYQGGSGGGGGGAGRPGSGSTPGAFGPANGDSVTTPVTPGGKGGAGIGSSDPVLGGLGGGALQLNISGKLTLDGDIYANGMPGWSDGSVCGGGGGGGAIFIITNEFEGSGYLKAMGGAGDSGCSSFNGGGGGGGRIYLKANTLITEPQCFVGGGMSADSGENGTAFYFTNSGDVTCSY